MHILSFLWTGVMYVYINSVNVYFYICGEGKVAPLPHPIHFATHVYFLCILANKICLNQWVLLSDSDSNPKKLINKSTSNLMPSVLSMWRLILSTWHMHITATYQILAPEIFRYDNVAQKNSQWLLGASGNPPPTLIKCRSIKILLAFTVCNAVVQCIIFVLLLVSLNMDWEKNWFWKRQLWNDSLLHSTSKLSLK